MIGKLTRTIVRTFAFALALCATSGTWAAVKPLAVWNGDFVANDPRNGYVININGNTISDGCITLNGSGGGVSVTNNTVTTRNSSNPFMIVAGIEGIKYTQNRSTQEALVTIYDSGSNRSDKDRACFVFWNGRTELRWFAAYMSNNNGTISEWGSGRYQDSTHVWPDDQALHYFGASYVVKDSIQTKGWRSYIDGILSSYTESTNSNDNDPPRITYGATIGGTTDGKRLLNNESTYATIKYIAVIRDTNGDTDTDIQAWSLTDMTTVSTDINTTTTTDGVNLPASATLTASATPAAVFVQQTSTLTVTGSGSLNINRGNGPLYVADGTTLTIDATGLTLNDGDTVTLVSGKIYGKDLITVKAPVITGLKVTPTITDTAITLTCETDSVSFTSPFTGNTLAAPATGTGYANSATQISFGNNAKFNQTIGDKTAIVVDIVGGTYEKLNGFLYTAENTAANARTKDVYLTLTGGTANRVSGVQDCTLWSYPGTTTTTGDAIVQIEDGATVDFVYGAGGAGGYSGYQVVVNGSTGVTIKGGTVSGSVVGGWTSSHNLNPTVNYDTAVRVETVMGTGTAETGSDIANGYIIGGSAYNRNQSSASTVGRDSSVTLALAGKSGAFGRTVIGGSAQVAGTTSGNQYVTRNSSVTITAANDVTFANPIVGGGAKLVSTGSGAVNVGGNSSVTISGGTYTGRIVAGGYAPNGGTANVAGTATLTLNSGVFTGATLDGGNATGAKALVIGDNLDITGAIVTGFTAVTLGDGATAQMATGEEGAVTLGEGATLKLIISEDDFVNGYTPSVSGSGTVEYYEYVESVLTKVTDSDRLDGNNLLSVVPVWSPAAADGNGNLSDVGRWSTGALPADNAAAVKITVNGSNTLTIDETRIFGRMDVEGTGSLVIQGDGAHNLAVGNLVVASSVTVEVKDSFSITTSIAVNDGILVLNPTDAVVSDEWTASDNGTLVVYIGSGETTTISAAITATKLIKRGAGVLVLSADNTISGCITVTAGTLKASTNVGCFGGADIPVYVEDGGAVDINNVRFLNRVHIIGDGPDGNGAYINTGDTTKADGAHSGGMQGNISNKLTLTGNASIGGDSTIHFGSSSSVDIGAYTLTKKGKFWLPLNNTRISGSGKIVISEGDFSINNSENDLSGIDLEITGGTLDMAAGTSMTVKNFKCATAITANAAAASSAKLIVNGKITANGTLTIPNLRLNNGASIELESTSSKVAVSGAFTFDTGTVTCQFADGVTPGNATFVDLTSLNLQSAPAGTFALSTALAEEYLPNKTAAGFSIAKGYASITAGGVTTPYADALALSTNMPETYDYITVLGEGDVSLYWIDGIKVKNPNGATISFIDLKDDSVASPSTVGDITTYTKTATPTTYTWTGNARYTDQWDENNNPLPDPRWTSLQNWTFVNSSSTTETASRYPTTGDSVVFNDSATVTLDANTTVAGIAVNGAVSLSVIGSTQSEIHSLTITQPINGNEDIGCQTSTLKVSDYGKVVFSDTGSWGNGVVQVGANGVLESQRDAQVAENLTLEDGSTLSFAEGYSLQIGAITLPASGTVTLDVTSLTLPTGTDKLTLFSTTTALDLTKFSVTGNSDYYLQQNAQDAETNPGAVTLQLYALKDNNGGYYRNATSALWAIAANHALTLTILDGTEEDWTADALSPYGLERSGTSVYYVAAKIGSTPYNSLQGAVDAAAGGETIMLAVNSDDSITLNGKSIVFSEGSYTFSGSFTGSGTLALTARLKSADPARWAEGWRGTVVLPTGTLTSPLNFNLYGISGSSVQITGDISGYLPNAEIVTTVKIPDSASLTLTSFSPSFANTFAKIEGEGTLSVPVEANNDNDLGNVANWGAGYNYSAYLLIKDVSGFTGSLTANKAVGIAIGTKPHKNTVGGKIILNSDKVATVGSSSAWTATNLKVEGTLSVESGGALSGSIEGEGQIVYLTSLPASTPTIGSSWTGTVVLPSFTAAGHNFNTYGRLGSKVKLSGVNGGWLEVDNLTFNPEIVLAGNFSITDMSQRSYTFNKISGSGNITFTPPQQHEYSGLTISVLASDYVGTIDNNMRDTKLTITRLDLASDPTVAKETKILSSTTAGKITVQNVYYNGTQVDLSHSLSIVNKADGVYIVRAGTIFSVY